jgi:hypothetical protein
MESIKSNHARRWHVLTLWVNAHINTHVHVYAVDEWIRFRQRRDLASILDRGKKGHLGSVFVHSIQYTVPNPLWEVVHHPANEIADPGLQMMGKQAQEDGER